MPVMPCGRALPPPWSFLPPRCGGLRDETIRQLSPIVGHARITRHEFFAKCEGLVSPLHLFDSFPGKRGLASSFAYAPSQSCLIFRLVGVSVGEPFPKALLPPGNTRLPRRAVQTGPAIGRRGRHCRQVTLKSRFPRDLPLPASPRCDELVQRASAAAGSSGQVLPRTSTVCLS